VLERAGIRRAQVLAACMGGDADNLALCFIARSRYAVTRTIATINNPRNAWLFDAHFHVDVAVNQAEILASLIEQEMSLGEMMTLLKLRRGRYSLVEDKIQPGVAGGRGRAARPALAAEGGHRRHHPQRRDRDSPRPGDVRLRATRCSPSWTKTRWRSWPRSSDIPSRSWESRGSKGTAMRRLDVALIALTLVLGAIWYYLRQADVSEPAGSLTARATTAARRPAGRNTPAPPARGPRPAAPGGSDEPAARGLRVEVDVPDADVFVDRVYKGKAPLVLSDVAPGSHRINVSAEGYDGYAETVEVTGADQLVSVRFKQVRLAAARRRRTQARDRVLSRPALRHALRSALRAGERGRCLRGAPRLRRAPGAGLPEEAAHGEAAAAAAPTTSRRRRGRRTRW
jgi:hypothetical protein